MSRFPSCFFFAVFFSLCLFNQLIFLSFWKAKRPRVNKKKTTETFVCFGLNKKPSSPPTLAPMLFVKYSTEPFIYKFLKSGSGAEPYAHIIQVFSLDWCSNVYFVCLESLQKVNVCTSWWQRVSFFTLSTDTVKQLCSGFTCKQLSNTINTSMEWSLVWTRP